MSAREWLRRPGHLLVAFLVVTLLPACALGALGWRLFQQDVALEAQYLQDRLEHAADRAVAALDAPARSPPGHALARRDLPPETMWSGWRSGRTASKPRRRIDCSTTLPRALPRALPTQPFLQGEALEFGRRDTEAAVAAFRQLADSRDPAIRAGALLRLARTLRTSGRQDEALAVYEQMALLGAAPVGAGPAELVARRARSELLLALGRRDEAEAETGRSSGRPARRALEARPIDVRVPRAGASRSRLEKPEADATDALALSAAVSMLWERYRGLGAGDSVSQGRESVWIDGRPVLLVWKGTSAVDDWRSRQGADTSSRCRGRSAMPAEAALTLTDSAGTRGAGHASAATTSRGRAAGRRHGPSLDDQGRGHRRGFRIGPRLNPPLPAPRGPRDAVAARGRRRHDRLARDGPRAGGGRAPVRLRLRGVPRVPHAPDVDAAPDRAAGGRGGHERGGARRVLRAPVAGDATAAPAGGGAAQLRADGVGTLPVPVRARPTSASSPQTSSRSSGGKSLADGLRGRAGGRGADCRARSTGRASRSPSGTCSRTR